MADLRALTDLADEVASLERSEMWGLSEEELLKAAGLINFSEHGRQHYRALAQAQLRKVVEEGGKLCPHTLPDESYPDRKRWCDLCWAELKQEAGLFS